MQSNQLTLRQIEEIYHRNREGYSNQEIAETLQICRNTVWLYLSNNATIPAQLVRKLGIKRPLVEKEWLTLAEASPWLPFQPSPETITKHIRAGDLKGATINNPHAVRARVQTVTRFEWMAEFVLSKFPPGMYVPIAEAENLLEEPDLPTEDLPVVKRIRPRVTPLPAFSSWAAKLGLSTHFDPIVIRRSLRCLDKLGAAVV